MYLYIPTNTSSHVYNLTKLSKAVSSKLDIIALFSYEQALLFKDLDPRNQLISNDTGYFSGAYAPNKDTLKAMYDLVN